MQSKTLCIKHHIFVTTNVVWAEENEEVAAEQMALYMCSHNQNFQILLLM